MRKILDLPLLLLLAGIGATAMLIPAIHAAAIHDWDTARAFLFPALFFLFVLSLIAIALSGRPPVNLARSHLLALCGMYLLLPLMLAVPVNEAVHDTRYFSAWWEMVSSLTTTGATLFDPGRLPPSVHLWRGLVGWMGGFFLLVAGIAILAPMNLGGFEVLAETVPGVTPSTKVQRGAAARRGAGERHGPGRGLSTATTGDRLAKQAMAVLPVYLTLTIALWAALQMAGDPALVAVIHAMATVSTSGISSVGGLQGGGAGIGGEVLIFLCLPLALSRRMMPEAGRRWRPAPLLQDPEIRIGLALVTAVAALLFLRHWIAAVEIRDGQDIPQAADALWGAVFTVLSFLTTTGFVSHGWEAARFWTGLPTPGLVLAGLAMIGGGVATTAGGIKLLRIYALYRHGERELQKLVHPSSIGGGGDAARRLRTRGAEIAWVFFALFALALAVTMLALSMTGIAFTPATVLSIAAIANVGPLASVATEAPLIWSDLDDAARAIVAVAMVVGRLETLAIIALLNPEMWRN